MKSRRILSPKTSFSLVLSLVTTMTLTGVGTSKMVFAGNASMKNSPTKAKSKTLDAWVFAQTHQIYGPQKVYLNPAWMMTENEREGTTYIKKQGIKNLVMFNRKKRVFYRGTSHSVMKRMALFSHLANKSMAESRDKSKSWKFSKKTKLLGLNAKIYSRYSDGKNWKIWVTDVPGIEPPVYKDYTDWTMVPDLGAMPLRLVVYSRNGKSTPILNTLSVAKTKVSAKRLKVPEGSKQVKEIFKVSSGRTEGLMESFSEILGD